MCCEKHYNLLQQAIEQNPGTDIAFRAMMSQSNLRNTCPNRDGNFWGHGNTLNQTQQTNKRENAMTIAIEVIADAKIPIDPIDPTIVTPKQTGDYYREIGSNIHKR